jgi:hypothetical protein
MIRINGKTFKGNSVSINNNVVVIDGVVIGTGDEKIINISVEGDLRELSVDHCATLKVSGNVNKLRTTSGDVEITGDVMGDIQTTSGDVECGNVKAGIITTSGDVECGDVGGRIQTVSGDVEHR